MSKKFSDQIIKFADKYDKRLRAAARYAVQETVEIAQKPRGAGGRMRIDTGFLRASIQAAVGQMPAGPVRGNPNAKYQLGSQVSGEPVSVVLLLWDPTKPVALYIGWTANYARFREYNDGFLRGATERWNATVGRAVARVKREIP